jgi:hypothetical protein
LIWRTDEGGWPKKVLLFELFLCSDDSREKPREVGDPADELETRVCENVIEVFECVDGAHDDVPMAFRLPKAPSRKFRRGLGLCTAKN